MSLTEVKVRGKKDFCIFFAGKQLMCCDRAPLAIQVQFQVYIQVYYKVWNRENMMYHCRQVVSYSYIRGEQWLEACN